MRPASVFDPLSARIAEEVGFACGMLAGSMASLAVLGAPDLCLITLSELAEQVRRISRASALPLLVDADHGYGNALNVMRTVEELEAAGAAALTIEDTALPNAFGALEERRYISIDEGAAKIAAAVAARGASLLVIAARTSMFATGHVEEALARIRAYSDAGADALFLTNIKSREHLEAAAAATNLPLMITGVPAEIDDLDWFAEHRVRLAFQGHAPIFAAYGALLESQTKLRGSKSAAADSSIASTISRLTRTEHYDSLQDAFLRKADRST
jgi:carboxyvinyl-carboxyphosphonate phosphorylmutase